MLNIASAGTQHPMHFSCAPARRTTDDNNKHSNKHNKPNGVVHPTWAARAACGPTPPSA